MPPFAVRIRVNGRVGPVLESVFADLDAEVSPRHTVVAVESGSVPDVVRVLRALEEREVEVDRIVGSICTRRG
jgi:hypothetical protein